MANTGDLPPMSAGLFGYFGYDMIRHIEAIPDANRAIIDTPDSMLVHPSLIAIFDRLTDSITFVVQVRPAEWDEPQAAWSHAQERIAAALDALDAPMPPTKAGESTASLSRPALEHGTGGFSSHGRCCQGLHPGWRHISGGALATFLDPVPPAGDQSLLQPSAA